MRTTALTLALLAAAPALAQEAESITFACTDGRVVEIAFPDAATAVIGIDGGEPVGLALIPPGDVAAGETVEEAETEEAVAAAGEVERPRYAGNGLQWIADGTAGGTLSAEDDAVGVGVACASAEPLEADVEAATGVATETE